jgi:hypothetical protein
MRPEALRHTFRRSDLWVRWAVVLWAALTVIVCARGALQPQKRNLYFTWRTAGGDWVQGADLYRPYFVPPLDQFRYSPPVAALLAPWHWLPEWAGNVLWRLLNAGALLGGLAWWLRAGAPAATTARQAAGIFLLVAPLALGSLNNGQPNPLLTGLLLASVAGVASGRWGAAAAAMALAVALKVYPLALGLLLVAAYPRRFGLRLALALALLAALPYLCQEPGYVSRQYALWYERLRPADEHRRHWPDEIAYRDLWLLLRVWGVPLTVSAYQAVQLAAAAGCAALVASLRWRGRPESAVGLAALTLGSAWMMLLGPATESCTYVVLAPALGWWLVQAHLARGRADRWAPAAAQALGLSAGLLGLCVLAGLSPNVTRFHGLGLHPLAALLFSCVTVGALLRELGVRSQGSGVRSQGSGIAGQDNGRGAVSQGVISLTPAP